MKRKKSLQIIVDLWTWLSENPLKDKFDWPEWEDNGGNVPYMISRCSCCEYVKPTVRGCENCPLIKLWRETNQNKNSDPCMGHGYYGQWLIAETSKFRRELALKIAGGARKELAKYK